MTRISLQEVFLKEIASTETSSVFYSVPSKAFESSISESLESIGAVKLLNNHDPLATVVETLEKKKLTTIFVDDITLVRSLPHLHKIKDFPVVINVELSQQDYSIIPSLKDLDIISLVSSDFSQACSGAESAYVLSTNLVQPVLHFINVPYDTSDEIDLQVAAKAVVSEVTETVEDLLKIEKFEFFSSTSNPTTVLVNLSPYATAFSKSLPSDACLLDIRVYRPWNLGEIFSIIPASVRKIVIVQKSDSAPSNVNGFEPIQLDFFSDFNALVEKNIDQLLVSNVGTIAEFSKTVKQIIDNVNLEQPNLALFVGESSGSSANEQLKASIAGAFRLEAAYEKVLHQLFGSEFEVLNSYQSENANVSNPEYGFGLFLKQRKDRQELINLAQKSLDAGVYASEEGAKIVQLLSQWIALNEKSLSQSEIKDANKLANELYDLLQNNNHSTTALTLLKKISSAKFLEFKSSWLIGSDAWSYDLGQSGVHHVLSSKENVNVLLIDSEPYNKVKDSLSSTRKKDVGLYAMNFGNVYVASVAVYASYTQLLTSFVEASKFNGPSIILAYLPYHSENDTPLEVLKETKNSVESGYWPLYRYDPSAQKDEDVFQLDSSVIRKQLEEFLDRENKLTLLSERSPDFARTLKHSAANAIEAKQERRAKAAFDKLLEGLSGPPIHIYYASDGGNASNLAKRLGTRASARGLKSTVLSMDDIDLEELPGEENVIFISSTAGQGEFPQDGKSFWDCIKSTTELDLASVNFSVFGLGDSLYWPRKEDKHYYNKPAKDLFKRLELLSAKQLVPLGLGDDQDADGYQTGYSEWEANLWEALGVSGAAVPDEPKPITNEDIKIGSNFLRGTIVEGLQDDSTGAISASDQQLTKFHGIYMQDDRDIRETRKAQGLEPYYIFMSRVRLPGGKASPEQWLVLDHLSDSTGNGTVKLTTRATFQLHGVVKKNLKHTIRSMNSTLMDTLAACGDVNRNVMLSALPANAKVHQQISDIGALISERFLPQTTAYHEIWLEGADNMDQDPSWPSIFENRKEGPNKKKTLVAGNALVDVEPVYGPTYLPRKFKINITVPPFNDVDVWSSDIGLVAIIEKETQKLTGFNIYVGGGMGSTHNNKKTYPRTGSCFGYVSVEDVCDAIEKIMIVQRDHGDRSNRKHARLKYTVDDLTVEGYKQRVEELWGKHFGPAAPFEIKSNIDYFGWVKDETGLNHFTAFIENGRVEDTPDLPQKTGLKKIAELMRQKNFGHFRLTGNQHVVISGVEDQFLEEVKSIMKKYKLDNNDFSGLRLSSAACVALPTCGLAMAESERYLPVLIGKLENALEEYGLRHDSIVMRMTGCPNGCARPWLAEVALVGKAPGTYNLMLGGGYYGQRLNKLYRASIKEEEILSILKPLFKRWSLERLSEEHFGDFLIRTGVIKPTSEGKFFHDDVPEEAL